MGDEILFICVAREEGREGGREGEGAGRGRGMKYKDLDGFFLFHVGVYASIRDLVSSSIS